MTTRKLTPAEALEVFRDWRAVERADMTSTAFYDKWGTFDRAVSVLQLLTRDAIDAIEEAMAQKPPADEAYPEWLRKSIEDHRKWAQSVRDKDAEKLHTLMARQEPAAPAPIVDIEPGTFVVVSPGAPCRFTERVIVRRFDEDKPAAPVPSDEEIVKQIEWARVAERHSATRTLVELLARRIGVQGVPK